MISISGIRSCFCRRTACRPNSEEDLAAPVGSELGLALLRLVEAVVVEVEVEAVSAVEVDNGADNEVGDEADTCLGTVEETVESCEVEL